MRPIDADELYTHKFKSASERMDLSVEYMGGWNDAIDAIIENAPTIEPAPTAFIPAFTTTSTDGQAEVKLVPERHGHWEFIGGYGYQYRCSNCVRCAEYRTDYCPNCGAKMDEVEE